MKIFTCDQIKEIDRLTTEYEPISPVDLMERAAGKLFEWIIKRYDRSASFIIFAGPGNNGGDGLVLARLLTVAGYETTVFFFDLNGKFSDEWKVNSSRLSSIGFSRMLKINSEGDLPALDQGEIVIDAIFGSGLSRRPGGIVAETIKYINASGCELISVDIPSGLAGEDNSGLSSDTVIRAGTTLTFQFPKLSMLFPENHQYTGNIHILPIGLHPAAIRETYTPYHFTELSEIAPLIKKRNKFDHKGIFGHGLLIAGSKGKAGAAILAARAAMRTGIGLLTCHSAAEVCRALQTALPEAMASFDINEDMISMSVPTENYSAVAAGPGIGTLAPTTGVITSLLENCSKPIVIDADAINILGAEKSRLNLVGNKMILTPHLKEFERIAGKSDNGFSRINLQMRYSVKYSCVVVLKGAYSSVSMPDGNVYFNSSGNQGMATAGSGDVLTGIILSLLAQGYETGTAALTGVFLHGLAGDIAAESLPYESIIASDIIDNLGGAFSRIKENI